MDQAHLHSQIPRAQTRWPHSLMNSGIYKDQQPWSGSYYTLKSLEIEPNNPDALINLSGIYKDLGKLEQAIAPPQVPSTQTRQQMLTPIWETYKKFGQSWSGSWPTLKSWAQAR